MYDFIMKNPEFIYPEIVTGQQVSVNTSNPVFFDTFSRIYFISKQWSHNITILPTTQISESIKHFFGSSFNYGPKFRIHQNQQTIIDQATDIYFNQGYKEFIKNYIDQRNTIVSLQHRYI